jgi:cytochrome c oxidase subunit 2
MKRFCRIVFGILASLILAGCKGSPSFLEPTGSVARKQSDLFWISHAFSIPVFLFVAGLLFYNLIRFRKREGQDRQVREIKHASRIETLYTLVPLILVLVMFVLTIGYMRATAEPESKENKLTIRVIGNRWYWEFEYPDYQFVTPDEFHIPVNTDVHLIVDSADVIHSFWIPQLAGKMDAIPGQNNEMWFRANETGELLGYCAEFCGTQHALMRNRVFVDTAEDFQAWVSLMQQPPPQPQTDLQQQGYDLITKGICSNCHTLGIEQDSHMLGPDLAHFSSHTTMVGSSNPLTEANLRRWLLDTNDMKPGNLMQIIPLTSEQVDALVAYLLMDEPTTDGTAPTNP